MAYEVRTRYGWGWEVIGDGFRSHPIEYAITAEMIADGLNEGKTIEEVMGLLEKHGYRFEDGRIYDPRP